MTLTKKKRTQEEIIADLPIVVHEHKIPQDQLSCPRCGNEELEYIGKELVYTEYVRVPAHVDRHDHYVEKYACHACEEGTGACESCEHAGTEACKTCADKPRTVIIAGNLPEEYRHPFIKGSKASSSIFSQILYEKFELGLPEYRQEKECFEVGNDFFNCCRFIIARDQDCDFIHCLSDPSVAVKTYEQLQRLPIW